MFTYWIKLAEISIEIKARNYIEADAEARRYISQYHSDIKNFFDKQLAVNETRNQFKLVSEK